MARLSKFALLSLLVSLVAALGIAACGGSSHSSSTTSTTKGKVNLPASAPVHGGRPHAQGFGAPPAGDFGIPKGQGLKALLTYQGLDAVTNSYIPVGTPVVGCYASGPYQNCGADQIRFPGSKLVSIATYDGAIARCLDTEPGDAVPSQDAAWVKWMLRIGVYRPCIYAAASEMPQVQADLAAAGLNRNTQYTLWIADWDNSPVIPAGYDAKQWSSNCCTDKDTFGSWFFQTVTPPKPKPAPKPPADPHHYLWFPVSPKVAGNKTERLTVEQYDGARQHTAKYASYLKKTLEPELRADANRVSYLAHHVWNHGAKKPNWSVNRGGWRFQQLIKRAQGQQFVK